MGGIDVTRVLASHRYPVSAGHTLLRQNLGSAAQGFQAAGKIKGLLAKRGEGGSCVHRVS